MRRTWWIIYCSFNTCHSEIIVFNTKMFFLKIMMWEFTLAYMSSVTCHFKFFKKYKLLNICCLSFNARCSYNTCFIGSCKKVKLESHIYAIYWNWGSDLRQFFMTENSISERQQKLEFSLFCCWWSLIKCVCQHYYFKTTFYRYWNI